MKESWEYLDVDEWQNLVSQGLSEQEIIERMGYIDIRQFRADLAIARINRKKAKKSDNSDN